MIKFIAITTILSTGVATAVLAEDDPFAGMPPLPMMDDASFDAAPPALPEPMAMEPLAPQMPSDLDKDIAQAPALPALSNDDEFNFFQQGEQLPPLPSDGLPPLPQETDFSATPSLDIPAPVVTAREPKNPFKKRLRKRFNYKKQKLSPTIYQASYNSQNRHLPTARDETGYDRVTFAAAASNNLNGLRAMLESGGRSIDMRNAYGETLADVAARSGAHTTLRYLTALKAPRS